VIKVLTIIGARPQIIKASAMSRCIRNSFKGQIEETILHTGQHYDHNMSDVFFQELEIPKPDMNLNVGSNTHGKQTSEMLVGIEEVCLKNKPDFVLVYGDTNSTLAGSLAASKLHIPCIHIEAGLRSFNKKMPEEVNRIVCDHLATFLFCPTSSAMQNLEHEGFSLQSKGPYSADEPGIFLSGDIMYDNSIFFEQKAKSSSTILKDLNLSPNNFSLCTVHRDHNTDNKVNFENIFLSLLEIIKTQSLKIVLPLHPRTKKLMSSNLSESLLSDIKKQNNLLIIDPVSFLDMIALESNSRIVLTDSGGVQKEAFFFKKPCVVLRPETEWIELVENGNNRLAAADQELIVQSFNHLYSKNDYTYPSFYGEGNAAELICNIILK